MFLPSMIIISGAAVLSLGIVVAWCQGFEAGRRQHHASLVAQARGRA